LAAGRKWAFPILPVLLLAAGLLAAPSWAQGEKGELLGQVFDAETGLPVAGVAVVVTGPAPREGEEPRQEARETGPDGSFEFPSLPAGSYAIGFSKPGYRPSKIDFLVRAGQANRADLPLSPLAGDQPPDQPTDIEELVVVGSTMAMQSLELRVVSDQLLNVLSAEELSRYAASDVAEGLKRVAGVNVVEGQFAIIRGLEDRYSSTLFNSAPVPSPDPDRQSVQLDLFPSEVVDDLVVAKTFGPALPSNSAAGSINIITNEYPEELEVSVKAAGGFNDNAVDRFLGLQSGSPVGTEDDELLPVDLEFGAFLGGRREFAEREVRFKGLYTWEREFDTLEGFQEAREPKRRNLPGENVPGEKFVQSGGLSLGELFLTEGRFDLTESERAEQGTAYGGFGVDLDEAGHHKLDASIFYTQKREEVVELKENGYLPNFDYRLLAQKDANGDEINGRSDFIGFSTQSAWIARSVRPLRDDQPSLGQLWFTNVAESDSFERERDLLLTQLNGQHRFDAVEGLGIQWAGNYAHTTENETALGTRYFFEPNDVFQPLPTAFPATVSALGPGRFAANPSILYSTNDIDEEQGFGRLDLDYGTSVLEALSVNLTSGGWYEYATRHVDSSFLETPSINPLTCTSCQGAGTQFVIFGDTPQQMGNAIFTNLTRLGDGSLSGERKTMNDSTREIWAWHLGAKATLWDQLDLLGGFRLEQILIESRNDAFTGGMRFGAPATFPVQYLFFDRLDNPSRGEVSVTALPPAGTFFNDQILGIDLAPNNPCPITGQPNRLCVDLLDRASIANLVNGKIDERYLLPSAGFTYRPIEGLSLRGSYSQTVARPSFREMGYYVSVEPGSDDRIVGNPQLGLSEVESWDARLEYVWGEFADLAALSGFYKTIDDPIESIVVRDPLNLEVSSTALFRTFFNNPNQASLWGIEVEARKNLGILGFDLGQYFFVGGNFTYIDAEVDRTEAELARSRQFFGTIPGDVELFSGLETSRRLFGQPEWIANADITFDQPDWGTKATLAFFAISDILDAAGSANIGPAGQVLSFTIDRYVDSYHQLDLILSQTWPVELLRGDLTFKVSLKNLTDSTRRIIYDPAQTADEIPERSYKVGRSFKFGITYSY
jgi:outer membrane receptor protein involved in Fe transport